MKLSPLHVRGDVTLWLDAQTGRAVPDPHPYAEDVRQVTSPPQLRDVLQAVERTRTTRVMLTGAAPPRSWFLGSVPDGWEHGRHHLDHETPTGRYRHTGAGVTVEVRRAAEWFGAGDYGPAVARDAWRALGRVLNATSRTGAALFRSPGATGRDLWLRAAGGQVPDPLDVETQRMIRATSPQHRIELMPPTSDTMPAVWVLDGRWMYAALTRGLGSGPVTMLTGAQAAEHYAAHPYGRARYRVRFRAPSWWREAFGTLGLLMARAGDLASDGWHCPLSGETWADAAEVHTAAEAGWHLEFLEGMAFTPGRPLDAWTARLVRARESVSDDELGGDVAQLVRGAVRTVLLYAIGAFHSSGSDETTVTASAMRRPDGEGWGAPERLDNGAALWRRRTEATHPRALAMAHPEWSSQVWGRARARMLECPTGERGGRRAGLLYVPAGTVAAVYGDALMLTERPAWADLDDGAPGRLRVKGHLCGPVPWPTTAHERDELTRAAETAGATCNGRCTR